MTNDEIQRTMEFIIKQQESFAENMGLADERLTRLERAFVGIVDIVNQTAKGLKEVVEQVKALTEAQASADDRLNIFINTVERYISNGRNGESRA